MCAAINIWCGLRHCTEVRFATFLSGGFITAIVKVRQSQNGFFKLTILPKNERVNSFFLPNSTMNEFVRSFFWKNSRIQKSPFEIN